MLHPDINKLYIENEYGVEYLDYSKTPSEDLVKSFKSRFNINTDCHNYCVNCQIAQINKYNDNNEWAVKTARTFIYSDKAFSQSLGSIKRFQKVTVVDKEQDKSLVSVSLNYGLCTRDESHRRVYREDKGDIPNLRCEECESALTPRVEKMEGWVYSQALTAFKVKCSFIPKEYTVPEKMKASLTVEEQEATLSLLDPVKWARDVLGVTLREHQKLDAMCTAKHTVRRWGRRSGKSFSECMKVLRFCLTETVYQGVDVNNTPIYTGPTVLVVSPFLSQISMLFDELKNLLSRNPDIEMTRDVKTPFYEIRLSNGAIIRGFTTGTQSGNEGGTIRGQKADLLLLDEVDLMNEKDIKEAIEPIQITSPNVNVMASSTPKGKREWFYKVCMSTPHYKETFFPSTVLDHWDSVKDEIGQEGLSDQQFFQEFMAEFISQTEGVYQVNYVASSEITYDYKQNHPILWNGGEVRFNGPQPGWIYSIGVDWNTNAGVEIVVTGLPADSVEFWVVDAVNIPKRDFQQHVAMEEIIELNRFWNPKYLYVDRGYGNVAIESLQIFSEKAKISSPGSADAHLRERLTAYDFGSKITYRNPATKQIEKQHAKPFLVENSVRQFEQGRVRFSHKDYVLHKQLLNYIVKSISPTGVPIYGMNDKKTGDHRLDALNLALIAYVLEMSDFAINSGSVTRVIHAGGFGTSNTRKMVREGEKNWIEFLGNLPENIGAPGRLNVRYDPGYVERKETERYNKETPSRTSGIDNKPKSDDKSLRLGFESDSEWKYVNNRKAISRIANIRTHKPKRRSF